VTTPESILANVLDRWRAGIEAHAPRRIAELFTEDAIFQGLRPYGVGRQVVFDYYDGQPPGLTATYELLETRRPAAGAVLGYARVVFGFTDGSEIPVLLGVLLTRTGDQWLIGHYQVSNEPAAT
jgi:hypothetical protein